MSLNGKYGPADAQDVAAWFGLSSKSRFAPEGHGPIEVQGYRVWVTPKSPRRMTLRTMTQCACGKVVPVGRLAQHLRRAKVHHHG